jgi:protein phosphatase
MTAKVEKLSITGHQRVICISDIHGSLDLFKRLLDKVSFCDEDLLLLLGDFYAKGNQSAETLLYVRELCEKPNVRALRGNGDRLYEDFMDGSDAEWLDSLPHIIDAGEYIFVHGGLEPGDLYAQDADRCMKTKAFAEQGLKFDRYVVTGHWPCENYTHDKPCDNPIVNEDSKIISIDGGNMVREGGQLNAFMILDGEFSFESVDDLPVETVTKAQKESGGTLHITWNDRFVEIIEKGEEFSLCRHIATGITLTLPNTTIYEGHGRFFAGSSATDYFMPVEPGDSVSVIYRFSDRIFAKKNGGGGWIML